MRTVVLFSIAACLALGCASTPRPRPLTSAERDRISSMHPGSRTAAIRGCDPEPDVGRFPPCKMLIQEVAEMLGRTGLFAAVRRPPETPGPDAIIVVVRPFERRPYYTKPSHNPALFLLSPVIPSWWAEPFGYRFAATDPSSGRTVEVDTRRTGTVVMWGFAPLLNLSEGRSFRRDPDLEQDHVRLQLARLSSN